MKSNTTAKKSADMLATIEEDISAIERAYEDAAFLLTKANDKAREANSLVIGLKLESERNGYSPAKEKRLFKTVFDVIFTEVEQFEEIAFSRLLEGIRLRENFDLKCFGAAYPEPAEMTEE